MHSRQFAMTNLESLEAESIYTLREIAVEFDRPVLLYSMGKDSSVEERVARVLEHLADHGVLSRSE